MWWVATRETAMTDHEALILAIIHNPDEDTPRLALADWFQENDQPERAEFVRLQCEAARKRPATRRRTELLDRAEGLVAEHEADWLGALADRLIDWEFRRGFLHRARMTVSSFLAHGEELFRREPVGSLELVDEAGEPLAEDAIRAAVAHPAFGLVRGVAVLPRPFLRHTPIGVWLAALAESPHVTRLRRFGPTPGGGFHYDPHPDVRTSGLTEESFGAFCRADHLRTLRSLNLAGGRGSNHPAQPWLVPLLAGSTFARTLRRLTLTGCGVTADGFRRLATDPVFGSLREVELGTNPGGRDGRRAVWHSTTLTNLRSASISVDQLREYVNSPLAGRVTALTISASGRDALDSGGQGREDWLALIGRVPPPRRLTLKCVNPGREVFAAMRRAGWLRDLRELDVSGDSQYEVYSGRTAGLRALFGRNTMPKLGRLRLHEACDNRVLAALAGWRGTARLESLELTDDYHGRLLPGGFNAEHPPERLRNVRGVVLITDHDVERFLGWPRLDRLESLKVSLCGEYDQATQGFTEEVTTAAAARLIRSDRLAHVTDLTLGFHHVPATQDRLVHVLADPAVMPRLRRVRVYSSWGNQNPSMDGLRARFGRRLQAR
jgi:uncharacterized protein (TIGR02996 family)